MEEKWVLINRNMDKTLHERLNVTPLITRLLANRNIKGIEDCKNFLYGDLNNLLDGFQMKDMKKGIEKIVDAIKNHKKIVIYGDYDCDGVVSTAILYKALEECNANFTYHIPHREYEGYGMNIDTIKSLKDEGCDIILTCDNGIAAHREIDYANSIGIDVILTDHHDVPIKISEGDSYGVPNAYAVINPKQDECHYNFKDLCGAGVAFKFVMCLYEILGIDKNKALKLVELCAIATVCDVVDILGENRIIVKEGLKLINDTDNLGIKELLKINNLQNKAISSYHLGFVIGPCINATGRLETAKLSVELLTTKDIERAKILAKELYELNARRQEMTTDSVEQVLEQIEKEHMKNDKILVVYNPNIHESIAGIVAGRVKEIYNVPTIILTKGHEMPKGSARSIEEYNIFEELSKCKKLLSKFGGHKMAAGLSIEEKNISILREKLIDNCTLDYDDFLLKVRIDCRIPLEYLNEKIIEDINILEPFGKGNPSPIFAEKNIKVSRFFVMGKNKDMFRLRCDIGNSYRKIDAVSFKGLDRFKDMFIDKYGEERYLKVLDCGQFDFDFRIDLVYVPKINEYNDTKSIQLIIKNIRI